MSKIKDKAVFESYNDNLFSHEDEHAFIENPFVRNTVREERIRCFNCGKLIPSVSEFCPFCRTKLYFECPNCHLKYSAEFPNCYRCGTNRDEFLSQQVERQAELDKIKNEELNDPVYKEEKMWFEHYFNKKRQNLPDDLNEAAGVLFNDYLVNHKGLHPSVFTPSKIKELINDIVLNQNN